MRRRWRRASLGQDDAVRLGRADDVDAVLYEQRSAAAQHLPQQHRRLVQLSAACQGMKHST